jgi:hypothetical protein
MTGTAVAPAPTDWKAALERLVPSVAALLRRATGQEPVRLSRPATRDITLAAPVSFPDGIGQGTLIAALFVYRSAVRLDVTLEHDRMLATPEGVHTGTPCFLNDYRTSITLGKDAAALPDAFVLRTVQGVKEARYGVDRHLKRNAQRWPTIAVVPRGTDLGAIPGESTRALRALLKDAGGTVATDWEDEEDE